MGFNVSRNMEGPIMTHSQIPPTDRPIHLEGGPQRILDDRKPLLRDPVPASLARTWGSGYTS